MNSSVVIDASLAVFSVLKTPHSAEAARVMEHLALRGCVLFAPGLWWYEVTSVIHRYVFASMLTEAIAYQALELLMAGFGVQPVDVSMRSAFDWATRLRQKAAYDGFYLAAAEQLGAELWTADHSLVNNAQQIGASWVHWMGEIQ
ncbi:MAG: type II toxin-antitoxin system VapC family toxin [Saprospiraceae bacterium]|nr:type II toxin-antitoxin system VapC family toxin [Saprospiraceae bacterium]